MPPYFPGVLDTYLFVQTHIDLIYFFVQFDQLRILVCLLSLENTELLPCVLVKRIELLGYVRYEALEVLHGRSVFQLVADVLLENSETRIKHVKSAEPFDVFLHELEVLLDCAEIALSDELHQLFLHLEETSLKSKVVFE